MMKGKSQWKEEMMKRKKMKIEKKMSMKYGREDHGSDGEEREKKDL